MPNERFWVYCRSGDWAGGGKGRGGKVRKKKIDIGRFYLYIIENGYIHISHTYI